MRTTLLIIAAIIALAMWLALPVPASAAVGACGQYELFAAALKNKYEERPADIGIGGPYLIILFLSPENSFTIIARRHDGFACIIAAGDDWERAKPLVREEKL